MSHPADTVARLRAALAGVDEALEELDEAVDEAAALAVELEVATLSAGDRNAGTAIARYGVADLGAGEVLEEVEYRSDDQVDDG